jgi:pimeloyl-ACP methyl ester carboxylesterase
MPNLARTKLIRQSIIKIKIAMQQELTSSDGNIYYTIQGKGPAVVFLHGFLEDHSIWDNFSDALLNRYTVITIDLPGFGKSTVFSDNHSMLFMAEKTAEILEQEHIEQCLLVGHSMGGYASLAFAKYYADKLSGLVLFHSQAAADTAEGKKNRDRTVDIVNSNHTGFITSFIPSLFAEENVARFSEEIERLKQTGLNTPKEGITAALKGMRDREDHRETLKKLDIPVYFIVGKKDSRIPAEVILPQLPLPKNSEALIMDSVGHMGFIEARERTFLAIEHFAERLLK